MLGYNSSVQEIQEYFEDQTYGHAMVVLVDEGTCSHDAIKAFSEAMRELGLEASDRIPQWKPETCSVGIFLSSYEGSSIPLHATCETQVYMNDEGQIVFKNTDTNEYAVLNVDSMLDRLRSMRDSAVTAA